MFIARVHEDVENFQRLCLCDENIWGTDQMNFDCQPMADQWNPPEVFIATPKKRVGDFLYLCAGTLVFRRRALDKLLEFFEMAGEILPLKCDTDEFFLLNVLECPNPLDQANTTWKSSPRTGVRLSIDAYRFHYDRLFESSLFKIPETSRGEVLTYGGIKNPSDEFRSRYESSQLTGLLFEELNVSKAV